MSQLNGRENIPVGARFYEDEGQAVPLAGQRGVLEGEIFFPSREPLACGFLVQTRRESRAAELAALKTRNEAT